MLCLTLVALVLYISEDAFEQLKAKGTDTQVMIRTMNGPRMHETKVPSGLVVSDLNGTNSIPLPKVLFQR